MKIKDHHLGLVQDVRIKTPTIMCSVREIATENKAEYVEFKQTVLLITVKYYSKEFSESERRLDQASLEKLADERLIAIEEYNRSHVWYIVTVKKGAQAEK